MLHMFQALFLTGLVVAVVALTDWRWGLGSGCLFGLWATVRLEMRRKPVT